MKMSQFTKASAIEKLTKAGVSVKDGRIARSDLAKVVKVISELVQQIEKADLEPSGDKALAAFGSWTSDHDGQNRNWTYLVGNGGNIIGLQINCIRSVYDKDWEVDVQSELVSDSEGQESVMVSTRVPGEVSESKLKKAVEDFAKDFYKQDKMNDGIAKKLLRKYMPKRK